MLGAVRESFGTTRERARRIIAASPNATSWNLADSGAFVVWFFKVGAQLGGEVLTDGGLGRGRPAS